MRAWTTNREEAFLLTQYEFIAKHSHVSLVSDVTNTYPTQYPNVGQVSYMELLRKTYPQ